MSEYELIESIEIVKCLGDDRIVYIKKVGDEIVGLNYMQGDEINYFKAHYCNVDKDLSMFYRAIHRKLIGEGELDRINHAIWAYFDYLNILGAEI